MRAQLEKLGSLVKGRWQIFSFVVVFAITGVVLLVSSFAQEPNKFPGESINTHYNQKRLIKEPAELVNSNTAIYRQSKYFKFSIEYPADWQLYRLSNATAVAGTVYLRLLSPSAKIGGESHSSELELSSGAMIEVSVFTNSQTAGAEAYAQKLGDYAQNLKKLTVDGKQAVQYQLASEDQNSSPLKTITTFFVGTTQYTVSLSLASNNASEAYLNNYQTVLNKFSTK